MIRICDLLGVLEPSLGHFDGSYLATYVSRDIQWAKKYGTHVILERLTSISWMHDISRVLVGWPSSETGVPRATTEENRSKAASRFHFTNVHLIN